MRQQLRLRVLVPVAVLGLAGAAFGAFAYGQPPEVPPVPPSPTTTAPATETTPTAKPKPKPKKPARTPLEREFRKHRAVVVVFYTPGAEVDTAAVREARAGAASSSAGFLAVNAASNRAVSKLAQEYEVLDAPAVLVLLRGGKAAAQFDGYVDRVTVAQAVTNALR